MCGIYVSVSKDVPASPSSELESRLRSRGPDALQRLETTINSPLGELHVLVVSTVLALRGSKPVPQPLVHAHIDDSNARAPLSFLCWNGEAWSIGGEDVRGNDTVAVFDKLIDCCRLDADATTEARAQALLSSIAGPFAYVFLDGLSGKIFFGRDRLGRRSLVTAQDDNQLILSSLPDPHLTPWSEVEPGSSHLDDTSPSLAHGQPLSVPRRSLLTRTRATEVFCRVACDQSFSFCSEVPATATTRITGDSASVKELEQQLRRSMNTRASTLETVSQAQNARVAVLFSGGVDCTLLARLLTDYLPEEEPIDLLNVAFENPRLLKAHRVDSQSSIYDLCPDRLTARKAVEELRTTCPTRVWNLVEIDIPFQEFQAQQALVVSLMAPHNTEMDLSIASALFFAARGVGNITTAASASPEAYTSKARVMLSGLGADELFGGYQRHATAFSRTGFSGLSDELLLDISRLGKRNLGRDDRVLSHWSRETRFPFLDEGLVAWATSLPVAQKTGFGMLPCGTKEETGLEDGKLILRLLAQKLGLPRTATERKRAIQFGARTAKMHTGQSRGTDLLAVW